MFFVKYANYPVPTVCPYCGGEVILTTNDYLYGRKYENNGNSNIYVCPKCRASVGTHPDGKTPLGIMADRELKELKKKAHALFDPLWKNGHMYRAQAYKALAEELGIPARECHMGWFGKETLNRVIALLQGKALSVRRR